jgi:hypothetical protein
MTAFTLLLENPPALSNCDRFGAARRIQLVQNGFDMRFHGADGHIQSQGNGLVTESEHHLSQYFFFPRSQRSMVHPFGDALGDQRTYGHTSDAHRSQTIEQILNTAAEQQVTACSSLQRVADLRLAVTMRQNYDSMSPHCARRDQA